LALSITGHLSEYITKDVAISPPRLVETFPVDLMMQVPITQGVTNLMAVPLIARHRILKNERMMDLALSVGI